MHADRIAALKVCYFVLPAGQHNYLLEMKYLIVRLLVCLNSLLQKEAEKRQALKRQGHGEYREITEGDFLGEVTGSEKVICHFYHREFYRCK